jgi:hypothetical protein
MNSQELRALQEAYNQVCKLDEASYSAKAARAGKDIGKPGKAFAKIAKEAGKRYGSEERGKKVAGAVLAKLRAEETDLFDYILEHLVAEGYADTNEAAIAIMTNMSEEWRQSIVESDALRNTIKTLEGKRDAMNANKPGSANTAAPGKQSVGAATYKAYQRLRGV